ncbi:hypothetical protein B0J12DRAFT_671035 [Macrophomina phaseolina]|uniref:Uncharacterized protein n=1 Tax=Macrophomina phaseolina TaxID=35725 RepID=A0ABQ8G4W7_9PEZI|nr:hypothetical protein B0J12DRAFT_671035 [Macrophomina phaseolina]
MRRRRRCARSAEMPALQHARRHQPERLEHALLQHVVLVARVRDEQAALQQGGVGELVGEEAVLGLQAGGEEVERKGRGWRGEERDVQEDERGLLVGGRGAGGLEVVVRGAGGRRGGGMVAPVGMRAFGFEGRAGGVVRVVVVGVGEVGVRVGVVVVGGGVAFLGGGDGRAAEGGGGRGGREGLGPVVGEGEGVGGHVGDGGGLGQLGVVREAARGAAGGSVAAFGGVGGWTEDEAVVVRRVVLDAGEWQVGVVREVLLEWSEHGGRSVDLDEVFFVEDEGRHGDGGAGMWRSNSAQWAGCGGGLEQAAV